MILHNYSAQRSMILQNYNALRSRANQAEYCTVWALKQRISYLSFEQFISYV